MLRLPARLLLCQAFSFPAACSTAACLSVCSNCKYSTNTCLEQKISSKIAGTSDTALLGRIPSARSFHAQAVEAVWSEHAVDSNHNLVEDWLSALHGVGLTPVARGTCSELLARHPQLLYKDPVHVSQVVQVLHDTVSQRRLHQPWFFSDKQMLHLMDRYTPESLRTRMAELHNQVWMKLDNPEELEQAFVHRHQRDLLDHDAESLAAKADVLRELVPEFLPSTVLRTCPELLDVAPEDLPRYIARAGNVVVVGFGVSAELQVPVADVSSAAAAVPVCMSALGDAVVVIYKLMVSSAVPSAAAGALYSTMLTPKTSWMQAQAVAAGSAWRRMSYYSFQREVVQVLSNTRALVYVSEQGSCDVRYEDPGKVEEVAGASLRK